MSESGFDWVWTVIPQISTYQTLVALATGWNAFTAGFTAPYPVFAQDTPPFTLNQSSTLNQTDGKPAECNSDSDPYQAVFESDVFESTFVTEFYLICNRAHLNSYAIQVSFIGIFIGAFVGGWTADKFGRKVTCVHVSFVTYMDHSFRKQWCWVCWRRRYHCCCKAYCPLMPCFSYVAAWSWPFNTWRLLPTVVLCAKLWGRKDAK